jgi:hypothetical protein
MNPGAIRFLVLGLVVALLTGCVSVDQAYIPVTGEDVSFVPAEIMSAQDSVQKYAASSSSLDGLPSKLDWHLAEAISMQGEYHFISGNWEMSVEAANANDENRQVMIINKVEKIYWCGHVKPDGTVLATCLLR